MSFQTRDGRDWMPEYLMSIDPKVCIGCGRCFKVCARSVMTLRGVTEDGEFVDMDEEDEDELERKVMVIADGGNCIGCGACYRVCPTGAQTHAAEAMAA
ncbi:ferredoxin III, nif-specific [Afifella sp. IM 167]|uniref:ferredoxin III, nif-specific n=1 Tax=Afifella sp. IM 167 TaxID=2033586 RepID=UPI001CCBDD38|nr:ferredoxin III, nif-specific [Afifella sp. IM 167]MBZ8135266.1 ferredoxin III, nif-specific [Afifella sp. IM 167]